MKTTDQILKIKAALLYILESFPEGVDYIKLFKILYFAQQSHLVKYGRPIVQESFYALKHGPVPSFTYKALQVAEGKLGKGTDFEDFLTDIQVRMSELVLVQGATQADRDELSKSDIKCLDDYSYD